MSVGGGAGAVPQAKVVTQVGTRDPLQIGMSRVQAALDDIAAKERVVEVARTVHQDPRSIEKAEQKLNESRARYSQLLLAPIQKENWKRVGLNHTSSVRTFTISSPTLRR